MGWAGLLGFTSTHHSYTSMFFLGEMKIFTAERFPSQENWKSFPEILSLFPYRQLHSPPLADTKVSCFEGIFFLPEFKARVFIRVVLDPWEVLTAAQTKASSHQSQSFALSFHGHKGFLTLGGFVSWVLPQLKPQLDPSWIKLCPKVVKEPLLGKNPDILGHGPGIIPLLLLGLQSTALYWWPSDLGYNELLRATPGTMKTWPSGGRSSIF